MTLTAVGVPLGQWITYTGFFRAWAEAERRADGHYSAKFIFVMLVCAFMLTATILTQTIASFLPPPSPARQAARADAFRRYDSAGVWMERHSLWLKVAAVAIGLAAAGVHYLMKRG